jgi:hypothetical protein
LAFRFVDAWLRADPGSLMIAHTLAQLLSDLP